MPTATDRERRRRAPVRETLRLLPRVSRWMTVALVAGVLVAATLPAALAVASGHLIATIGAAAGQGFNSAAGRAVVVAIGLLVGVFALQQLSVPGLRSLA